MNNSLEEVTKNDILSLGYGIIPKKIMVDSRISIEAKGIYAYLCSFAGRDNVAFPSKKRILSDLNISENRYYKHRQQLIDFGYLVAQVQETENNFRKTMFYIIQKVFNNHTFDDSLKIKGKEILKSKSNNQYKNICIQNQNLQNEGGGDPQNKGHNNNNIQITNLDTLDTYYCNKFNTNENCDDNDKELFLNFWENKALDKDTLTWICLFSKTNGKFDLNKATNLTDLIFKAKKSAEKELIADNIISEKSLTTIDLGKDKDGAQYYSIDFEEVSFSYQLKNLLYKLKKDSSIKNKTKYMFISLKNIFKDCILFTHTKNSASKIVVPIIK